MTNLKIGTIEEEEARCRRAFEGVEVGALVHCCHHAIHFEHLTEPWENRINYILREKPEYERAERLRWFRPVTKEQITKMSPHCQKADDKWRKAYDERQKACDERQKAEDEWRKAYDEWRKACDEWRKAYDERQKAEDEWRKADDKWRKACVEYQKTDDKWRKACAEWRKADDKWRKACVEYQKTDLCPKGCPWNGKDIFGKRP